MTLLHSFEKEITCSSEDIRSLSHVVKVSLIATLTLDYCSGDCLLLVQVIEAVTHLSDQTDSIIADRRGRLFYTEGVVYY